MTIKSQKSIGEEGEKDGGSKGGKEWRIEKEGRPQKTKSIVGRLFHYRENENNNTIWKLL